MGLAGVDGLSFQAVVGQQGAITLVEQITSPRLFTAAVSRSVRCIWGTPPGSQKVFWSPWLRLSKLSETTREDRLAAERLLQRSHGYRYYSWEIHQGGFRYFENAAGLGSEKGIEGKYVIATSESGLSVLEVVAIYKDLSDVERGFRQLKDVLAMRPIYHQIEAQVKAHIFVAALAFLVQRLLDRRLEEAGIDFSTERAMEALQTVRLVTFRMDDRPERRGVSGGCPDAPGSEGPEADRIEAADTPRGGRDRDVVTIRKFESCLPRGYVEAPQTCA